MYDDTIIVTPDALNDCARKLRFFLEESLAAITDIHRAVDDTASRWDGASSCAYLPGCLASIRTIESKLRENIETLADDLDTAANVLRDADLELAKQIGRQDYQHV